DNSCLQSYLELFIFSCVDYGIIFGEKEVPHSSKTTFFDSFLPLKTCFFCYNFTIVCFPIACIIFLWKSARIAYNLYLYLDIKDFYLTALKIKEEEIDNFTWHEIQHRLQAVQREQQMCIHKQELTELDIYHRILRYKNYMVAMINKDILPVKFTLPIFGEVIFFSKGLKWNYEQLLLLGYDTPFMQWSLKDEYKVFENRTMLANRLASRSRWLGFVNLILSPAIFIWQVLYSFLTYGEMVKRQPGFFGTRRWSQYGRLYLRHFNELDHELNARLNRGYRPAAKYMTIFTSPKSEIIARKVIFFCAAILSVLLFCAVYNDAIFRIDHALTLVTCLGGVIVAAQGFVPDENLVFCPEKLFLAVLAQIHYMPHEWYGKSHTMKVRNEFGRLFQYKFSYVVMEMLSPLICPFILIFVLPNRMGKVIDFYRNFTVSVIGVGDVCSFAQMDIRKHGNPQWMSPGQKQHTGFQAQDGKTELSLMHFTLTNPDWKPPTESTAFITNIRHRATRDAHSLGVLPEINPFYYSLYSLSSFGPEYSSLIGSLMQNSTTQSFYPNAPLAGAVKPIMRGGLSNVEGPIHGSNAGLLSSIPSVAGGSCGSGESSIQAPLSSLPHLPAELNAANMSFGALYMHQLRRSETEQSNQPEQELSHIAANILGNPPREIQQIQEEHNENTPLVDFLTERYT
uniref:Autophagy-related protein 9 n=1 Tax=Strigamia maritima TaxID=126957 RepID=T1JD90_STRMM